MKYPKEDCIEKLRKASSIVDGELTAPKYRDLGVSPSVRTLANKFGSWNKAKQAAKLDTFRVGETELNSEKPASYLNEERGYVYWQVKHKSEVYNLPVHRLVAVAKFGFDAVCGMEVHHKNEIKWDNRPQNLEILTPSEHRKMHCEIEKERGNGIFAPA